ncbi:hypothetical protein D3C81_1501710 [compost metagenome]
MVLQREVGVEAHVDAAGGAGGRGQVGGLVIEPAGGELTLGVIVQLAPVAQALVDPRTGLHGLKIGLGIELVPALVRPALATWPPLGGRTHRRAVEEGFDLRFPGVAVQHIGKLRRKGRQSRLAQEGLQRRAGRAAAGDVVGVL